MKERTDYYNKYSNKLKKFCDDNDYLFIDPNKYIFDVLNKKSFSDYMVDYIHPNANKGVELYSIAVQNCSIN